MVALVVFVALTAGAGMAAGAVVAAGTVTEAGAAGAAGVEGAGVCAYAPAANKPAIRVVRILCIKTFRCRRVNVCGTSFANGLRGFYTTAAMLGG